jgi:hypothetical protein
LYSKVSDGCYGDGVERGRRGHQRYDITPVSVIERTVERGRRGHQRYDITPVSVIERTVERGRRGHQRYDITPVSVCERTVYMYRFIIIVTVRSPEI